MDVPGIVESALDGEEVAAQVDLGGEDELFITPTRTLIFRSEGLLSDQTVEEYAHDAERLVVSEGRRKTRFSLDYPLDGTEEFTIPSKHGEDALHPVLAGLMNASGVTDPGETVLHTYWFSELTIVITSDRLVKHIGEAVWDEEYEEYHYGDLTGIEFEEGRHATQLVLDVQGRKERIKVPSDEAREVQEHLKRALFEFHDVGTMRELNEKIVPEDREDDRSGGGGGSEMDFGGGVEPLDASPSSSNQSQAGRSSNAAGSASAGSTVGQDSGTDESAPADTADEGATASATSSAVDDLVEEDLSPSGAESRSANRAEQAADQGEDTGTAADGAATGEQGAGTEAETQIDPEVDVEAQSIENAQDVGTELQELRVVVEKQNKLLARQQRTIEQLIEELKRGR